jgi:hypothetical protein
MNGIERMRKQIAEAKKAGTEYFAQSLVEAEALLDVAERAQRFERQYQQSKGATWTLGEAQVLDRMQDDLLAALSNLEEVLKP